MGIHSSVSYYQAKAQDPSVGLGFRLIGFMIITPFCNGKL